MDFTIRMYTELLQAMQAAGYSFSTLEAFLRNPTPNTLILRHDVDAMPQNSLAFAQIQHSQNIRGVYYFRATSGSWNDRIIRQIADMGHEVGYHYECLTTCKGNKELAILDFEKNLTALRRLAPVSTICMHGSPMSKYDSKDLWKTYSYSDFDIVDTGAEKEGCTVVLNKNPEALTECYAILTEVYQRAKLPLPNYSHFDAIWQHTTDQIGLRLFTAMWEGQIIGCVLCLACGDTLYDYYAGAYSRYYSKYPNDLLPWAVIMWGKENGFSWFDFGGAGKPGVPYGVRDYKKKFGGSFVNHGRYEKNHYPALLAVANQLFTLWRAVKR